MMKACEVSNFHSLEGKYDNVVFVFFFTVFTILTRLFYNVARRN